tara:strand:- start:4158 stop:4643 length:486 start_codon:yes stop_codon:yes gene_type:complete
MILTPAFIAMMLFVFILVWLFVNTIDKRKWLGFLISLVLAPVVYFYLFYPMLNIFSSYHHQKHFDSEAWKEKPALRYEMTDKIIQEDIFIGKTKTELKNLLGKSEWNTWDETIKANSPDKWNYNLGFKPGAFNNMQETVELIFSNDTLKTIRQYQKELTFE